MPDAGTEAANARPDIGDVRIQDVTSIKEQTTFEKLISSQAFWVFIALIFRDIGVEKEQGNASNLYLPDLHVQRTARQRYVHLE